MKYDFKGWATKYNVPCSDGRTIKPGAFKDQDGAKVPLVWGHIHDDPTAVLGHAYLYHRDEGVYTYGVFNDTEQGRDAREMVNHGDIDSVSICAGKLQERPNGKGKDVFHGKIRELSLVLSGANEGARIEPILTHSDPENGDTIEEAIIYNDEFIELNHSDEDIPEDVPAEESIMHEEKGANQMANESKEKTIKDVIDSMNEEQQAVLFGLLEELAAKNEKEGTDSMKHNVFDNDTVYSVESEGTVLTHSDLKNIVANAKRAGGSMREAYNDYVSELRHDGTDRKPTDLDPVEYRDRNGNIINYNTDTNGPYGVGNYDIMFPDARLVGDRPSVIRRENSWVSKVVNGAKHSPFSRIKTIHADLTEDAARAKGYIKGKYKKNEFFALLRRVTTPVTIYKKQKLDRDDIIDITDWDIVAWLRQEMRWMLDEELARAALVSDGRLADDEDKISEDHIRPIATDSDLYTVKVNIDVDDFNDTDALAKAFIRSVIANRKLYKGSGDPTLFTTEDMLTNCLLLTDDIGRDLYENEAKLATKMRVKEIVTVPVMENGDIFGILVNMADYTFGSDKGGSVDMMDDFDIDFNQYKYLIETRVSGALTLPYSAMVFRKPTARPIGEADDGAGDYVINNDH